MLPTNPQQGLSNAVTLNAVANAYTNLADSAVRRVEIPQNQPLSLAAVFVGSSSLVTTNVIGIGWALTTDGTNYCNATNQYIWQLVYPRGTTTVYSQSNFPSWLFTGARYMKIAQVTNNTFATTNMTGTLSQVFVGSAQ